jgi:hypothetical protein
MLFCETLTDEKAINLENRFSLNVGHATHPSVLPQLLSLFVCCDDDCHYNITI